MCAHEGDNPVMASGDTPDSVGRGRGGNVRRLPQTLRFPGCLARVETDDRSQRCECLLSTCRWRQGGRANQD